MTRETAFHSSFAKHTRNFVEYKGYWLANSFAKEGPIEEYWACRQDAVIMDLSPLRKFEVTGPDSEALLQYTLTRDVKKLGVGQVVYSAMCYEHGGMIDDGTLFRLGENNFRWIGGVDYGGIWLREQAEKLGLKVWVRSSTDQLHNVAVQGPKSRDILRDVIWTPPAQPGPRRRTSQRPTATFRGPWTRRNCCSTTPPRTAFPCPTAGGRPMRSRHPRP